MIHKVICEKITVFNRQLISVNKHMMCCEGTAVGVRLYVDGVKH
jgi:hypothetical protein